jgi:hypothetical protein
MNPTMADFYIITAKEVLTARCETLPPERTDREKFLVEIYDDQDKRINDFTIKFMIPLPNMNLSRAYVGITPQEIKCLFAIRASKIWMDEKKESEGTILIRGEWHNKLFDDEASPDEIGEKLKPLVHRFFKHYPLHKFISPQDLFVSAGFNLDKIVDRLDYFVQLGFIASAGDQRGAPYKLAPGGLIRLEQQLKTQTTEPKVENRYFKLVKISVDTTQPFVFVLMPFKESEFDQSYYTKVIKPTIENDLKLRCIRSDEITDPGVINDQIYTAIVKAKVVIAEVSTQNPNVFYELGLAHTLDKDVYILRRKDAKRPPFDISTDRAIEYEDEEDLKQKIISHLMHLR